MNIDDQRFATCPMFAPLRPTILKFGPLTHPPSLDALNQILDVDGLRFIPQQVRTNVFEETYEPRIFLKQEIETRENSWHDFFNALVWKCFSKTKRAINRLHYHQQKRRLPNKQRLPSENMLTLFDENGAIVVATHQRYLDLIREHQWHELFWQRREEILQHVKVIIFGHGLYEKALQPYVGLTAQCLMFVDSEHALASVDTLVSAYLQHHSDELRPSLLAPLPILGLPGWWHSNCDEAFYANKAYFRLPKQREHAQG